MRQISKILIKIYRTWPNSGKRLVFEFFRGSDDSIMQKVYLLRLLRPLLRSKSVNFRQHFRNLPRISPLCVLCNIFLNGTVPDTGCSINLYEWVSGHRPKSGKCLTRIKIVRGVLQVFS
jgi:hypothetical protein